MVAIVLQQRQTKWWVYVAMALVVLVQTQQVDGQEASLNDAMTSLHKLLDRFEAAVSMVRTNVDPIVAHVGETLLHAKEWLEELVGNQYVHVADMLLKAKEHNLGMEACLVTHNRFLDIPERLFIDMQSKIDRDLVSSIEEKRNLLYREHSHLNNTLQASSVALIQCTVTNTMDASRCEDLRIKLIGISGKYHLELPNKLREISDLAADRISNLLSALTAMVQDATRTINVEAVEVSNCIHGKLSADIHAYKNERKPRFSPLFQLGL